MDSNDESVRVDFGDPLQVAAIVQRLCDSISTLKQDVHGLSALLSYVAHVDGSREIRAMLMSERLQIIAGAIAPNFPLSTILPVLARGLQPETLPKPILSLVRNAESEFANG